MWNFCFFAAIAVMLVALAGVFLTGKKYRSGRLFTPSNILFAGVLVSALLLFIPIYINTTKANGGGLLEALFLSIYNMICLFVVNSDFEFLAQSVAALSPALYSGYSIFLSILFVLAPVLTFGFVLSFFKNITAYQKFLFNFRTEAYIFSELNEKTLALAESISRQPGKRMFVFSDVFEKEEEQSYEMVEKARELGAVCFKKDIVTINFSMHSKSSPLHFFTMGADQSENISQALKLMELYRTRENTHLYVLSTQVEAEMLLANAESGCIKVRRINEVQSLIYRNLNETGLKIFENAKDGRISAVVVGMGNHGTEMTKALAWFCQMDGYQVHIDSFDKDQKAPSKFRALCPELMAQNGNFTDDGEAMHQITVHGDMDVETAEFTEAIRSLKDVTYVMVALGNDELNIKVAVRLRVLFEQMGITPIIQAIVYNSEKSAALTGITNHSGQSYEISFIGDLKSTYSYEVVLDCDLEEEGLARHLKWGDEESFWRYEYNYRSSVASALHKRMKIACGMPGIELPPEKRGEKELWALRRLEHRRWNAYMRAEGFVYAPERNNLAKTHHCLVTFDLLSEKDKMKDDD
ncbi:MAG: hypothetical protein IJ043_10205 [Clostridia bacterium]|nr:hypothetical protein [Clostridia bacterium]